MNNRRKLLAKGLMLALIVSACVGLLISTSTAFRAKAQQNVTPDLNELDAGKSELRPVIERHRRGCPTRHRPPHRQGYVGAVAGRQE